MSLKMLTFHNIILPIKYNTLSCLVQVGLGAEKKAKEKKNVDNLGVTDFEVGRTSPC